MPGYIAVEDRNSDPVVNLCLDTMSKNKQALVFVNNKRSAEKSAEDVSKSSRITSAELEKLSEKVLNALPKPTVQCKRLASCVKKGIAFHHAGLTQKQKELVEDAFKANLIKIICCTPTLAAGVDLPAFRSIIRDLKRYGKSGLSYIPVIEFEQIAGRAGRPKFDSYGEAICIAKTFDEKMEIEEHYFNGEIEEIYSKLAVEPVLRTYLLSLIASNFVNTKESIIKFFEATFWAHHYKDMNMLKNIIEKMLRLLEEFEFIKSSNHAPKCDFISASDLSNEKESYHATMLGARVAQLYLDPLTAHYIIECLNKAIETKPDGFALLHMICSTLEMRPLLNATAKDLELINDTWAKSEDNLLVNANTIYDSEEFMNSLKTAMFMDDWCNESDEECLLEKYNIRPGEIKVKLDLGDWLLYSSCELARILQFQPILKSIINVRLRLQYGVKEELLPLLKLKGIGRVRARKLYSSKIKDIGDLNRASYEELAGILGKEIAANLKEQLGQPIPENNRDSRLAGQLRLEQFGS